jgi:hypothetical protein
MSARRVVQVVESLCKVDMTVLKMEQAVLGRRAEQTMVPANTLRCRIR